MLMREGIVVNRKRLYRLYRELTLQLRNRRPKRRVQALRRKEMTIATVGNEHWSMDFMSDRLFTGERIRLLTIVNNYSKLSPAREVRKSFKGADMVRVLEQVVSKYGLPKIIKPDNGAEFISRELDLWAYGNKVGLDYSRLGKPTDNAYIESFNGRVRQECLNQNRFLSLANAQAKIDDRREDYNSNRPHGSLRYKTPEEFAGLPSN